MKRKLIFPCIMALTFVSGCIKEQGEEPYTITRNDVKVYDANSKSKTKETDSYTIVTGQGGYMYGKAVIDSIVRNSFDVTIDNNNTAAELDCFVQLYSQFTELNIEKNSVKDVGVVYSHTNDSPIVEGRDCDAVKSSNIDKVLVNENSDSIVFISRCNKLDFNTPYYFRSYIVTTEDDTIYNQRVLKTNTVLPHDVWFERKKTANFARRDCFSCQEGDSVYVYGGRTGTTYHNDLWVYDATNDVWTQKATCNQGGLMAAGKERRSNGAMFLYKMANSEIYGNLLYIVGGELESGSATETVLFYNTKFNRFCNQIDHPNYGKQLPYYEEENGKRVKQFFWTYVDENNNQQKVRKSEIPEAYINSATQTDQVVMANANLGYVKSLPQALKGCVAFTMEYMGVRCYYIGYGKNEKDAPIASVYRYDVEKDLRDTYYAEGKQPLSWNQVGNNQKDRTVEGLYQPVVINRGSSIVLGTGVSSNGGVSKNFYLLRIGDGEDYMNVESINGVPADFSGRANASAFYLNYSEEGVTHEKMFVGIGRTSEKEESADLLGDFWSYDFSTQTWKKCADFANGRYCREGAIGYSVNRTDDIFSKSYDGSKQRGVFSFGYGREYGTDNYSCFGDSWEYLP